MRPGVRVGVLGVRYHSKTPTGSTAQINTALKASLHTGFVQHFNSRKLCSKTSDRCLGPSL